VDQLLFMRDIPRLNLVSLSRINFDHDWFALDVGVGIDCYIWQQFGAFRVLTEYGQTFAFQSSCGVPQFIARATLSRTGDNLNFEFFDMLNSSRKLDCGYALRYFTLNEWLMPFLKYQDSQRYHRLFCTFSGVDAVSVSFKIASTVKFDFKNYSMGTSGKVIFFRDDAKPIENDSSKNFFFVSGNLIEVEVSKQEMSTCNGRKMPQVGFCPLDDGRYLIYEYCQSIYPLCKAWSIPSGSWMDKSMHNRHNDTCLRSWSSLENYIVLYFRIQFLMKKYRKRDVVINHDLRKKNKRNRKKKNKN